MARRTGEEARLAILEAAEAAFAARGRHGARINEIAADAHASKERLYTYFADKDALFTEVVDRVLTRIAAAVPLDVDDLGQYVADLLDWFHAHPTDVRLAFWVQLDGTGGSPQLTTERQHDLAAKVATVAGGQRDGRVDPSWDPAHLLRLLLALAVHWAVSPDGSTIDPLELSTDERARQREAARAAATRLTRPEQRTPTVSRSSSSPGP